MAPAGTPAPVIAKAHQQVVKIAAQADMREARAARPRRRHRLTDEFAAVIKADIAKWAKVIKDANIKLSE